MQQIRDIKPTKLLIMEGMLMSLALVLPFSEALVSIITVLIFVFSWLIISPNEKFNLFRKNPLPVFPSGIFLLYLIWAIGTHHPANAIDEIRRNVFWFLIPAAVAYLPISREQLNRILYALVLGVVISSLVAFVRWNFRESIGITDIRDATLNPHIAHSLLVNFALFFLFQQIFRYRANNWYARQILRLAGVLFLLFFNFWLHSLLGLLTLFAALILLPFSTYREIPVRLRKYVWSGAVVLIIIPMAPIGRELYRQFHTSMPAPNQVAQFTLNGNRYQNDFSKTLRENGHFIYLNICLPELQKEWNHRSSLKFSGLDANGFPVKSTLIRYLTSKGLTKDSAGVSHLTNKDIQSVNEGFANYRYVPGRMDLSARIYQTIWELDAFRSNGNPNNKSLVQRWAYTRAALSIIAEHPFVGVGTGNEKAAFNETLMRQTPKLRPANFSHAHNQYLNYLVTFGIPGFAILLFLLIYPPFRVGKLSVITIFFLLTIGIANLGDDNLQTHTIRTFFVLFYSLLVFGPPLNTKESTGSFVLNNEHQ
ncbi:O-antigen ligase [Prolixibacter sp. SD074]|uniref:O-antigen ligase family protein n=1 Tax=Prolixibacter sp. SD074 TaxID=2652391 RepID=UPI001299230D|nr:O-antigen ligase family protein [Prolixibacter sp. SD074]